MDSGVLAESDQSCHTLVYNASGLGSQSTAMVVVAAAPEIRSYASHYPMNFEMPDRRSPDEDVVYKASAGHGAIDHKVVVQSRATRYMLQ